MSLRQFKVLGSKSKQLWNLRSDSFNKVSNLCKLSTTTECSPKICVIGAGPAGFYASQQILRTIPNAHIDIIEKLPVPFGLVRHVIVPYQMVIIMNVLLCITAYNTIYPKLISFILEPGFIFLLFLSLSLFLSFLGFS